MANKRLIATDLDGTFIGDDQAMFGLWEALADLPDLTRAFSTGRHLRSIQKFYAERSFPGRADVCICMVGTDVHWRRDGEYELDSKWHEIISEAWDKQRVEAILHDIPEATMQDQQWQSPYKSSYCLDKNAEPRLREIRAALEAAGLQAKVVYSADKFLDLLPIRSGKGEAVKYVAGRLGVSPDQVVTCGDTGNDLDMMRTELGFRGIAVGNAAPELKAFTEPHVYHANASFAAGIQEGLAHYGWL